MAPNLRVRLDGRDHSFAGHQDIKLGRDPGADVHTGNERVSRNHAVLRPEGASWVLEDVGSLHGTFVDGERVTRHTIGGGAPVTVWLAEPGQGQVLQLLPEGTTSRSGVFISYRRDDAAGHAGRLYDRLRDQFGSNEIFRDIDNIGPGDDFVNRVEQAVGSCQVLLAVISRNWAGARPDRERRIDLPDDWVRLEVAAALKRNVKVIPVLVQKAEMPTANDLPDELKPLARRHALLLDDERWEFDCSRLIKALEGSVGGGRRGARRWEAGRAPAPDAEEGPTAGREDRERPRQPGRSPSPPADPPIAEGRTPWTPPPTPPPQQTPPPMPPPQTPPQPQPQPRPPPDWGAAPRPGRTSSFAGWWLVVAFVPLFGGFMAWASVKPRDPRAARSMLITGIIVSGMLFFSLFALIPTS